MKLSSDLISQFVKVTKDTTKTKKDTTVYGTIVRSENDDDNYIYVRFDGSESTTPINTNNIMTTTELGVGDRVIVTIKNHTAIITGNLSSPSAKVATVAGVSADVNAKLAAFEKVIANSITVGDLDAERARISKLEAADVTITGQLTAMDGNVKSLQTDKLDASQAAITYATIDNLEATDAKIGKVEGELGKFKTLTTEDFSSVKASINDLQANKVSAKDIEGKYANIDFSNISKATMEWFYANSGLIENVVVGDGTITGSLVGVTIKGDLIEGNTIKADKLVIKGTDGLYYKLNTDGVKTEAEQTDYNSINGSIITAKSITATKINVDDLVAFDATIGGFNITDNSIYSGTKASVDNTTRGVYLDSTGQMAIGDASNFIKYYKDANGAYKLAISANSILFGSSSKSIETAFDDIQDSVENIEVGGRNLLLKSATKKINPYLETTATHELGVEVEEWNTTEAMRIYGTGGTASIFGTLGGTAYNGPAHETQAYSASIYIKNNHSTKAVIIAGNHLSGVSMTVEPLAEKKVELIGLGNGWGYLQFNFKTPVAGDEFDITYWHPKIELGNKPSDWTPAPEDMATAEDMGVVETLAENANTKAEAANSLIAQLSDSISMLVTDGNGTSLMTQTEDGWTFSTADIQGAINTASQSLNTLTNELGDTNNTVNVLKQAVDDLGVISEYVKIGTYEGEPCIELGEGDSDFKLIITNTRIMFMEGSGVPAYINNQSLHIKKAVVEEELQHGNFVWKVRSNGNMGLVWKGGVN